MSKEDKKDDELKPDEVELKEASSDISCIWEAIQIYKERTQNREVIELKNLDTGECHYKGGIIIALQRNTPQGIATQPIRHEFDFPEGWTREKCFKHFDAQGQKAAEEWQAKAAASRRQIVAPPQAGSGVVKRIDEQRKGRRKRRRY